VPDAVDEALLSPFCQAQLYLRVQLYNLDRSVPVHVSLLQPLGHFSHLHMLLHSHHFSAKVAACIPGCFCCVTSLKHVSMGRASQPYSVPRVLYIAANAFLAGMVLYWRRYTHANQYIAGAWHCSCGQQTCTGLSCLS